MVFRTTAFLAIRERLFAARLFGQSGQVGMSLIEVLVVMGLLSVVALGMGQVITDARRAQKGIDLKSEVQSIGSGLRLMLLSSRSCQKSFGIDSSTSTNASGVTVVSAVPSEFTPRWLGYQLPQPGASASPEPRDVEQIRLGDQTLSVGGDIGKSLTVESLVVTPRYSPQSGEYLGDLQIVLRKKAGVESIGLGVFSETVPIRFRVGPDPSGTGKLAMTDCQGSSELEPKATCDGMGGMWLEDTLPGRYMPKDRCNFGQDIFLSNNEAPDPVNVIGGANSGQRVEECYYTSGTVVKTYLCPARSATRSGDRCMFAYGVNDTWAKQWQVRYFSASSMGGNWSSTVKINCDKGVKITMHSPMTDTLDHDEPLWLAYGDEEPATNLDKFLYEQDRITSVTRCKTSPDQELYVNCANPNNAAAAKDGQGASCIFVRNIRLSLSSNAQQNAFSDYNNQCSGSCQDLSVNNYTGWILVNPSLPRQSIVQNINQGNSLPSIREARGSPCYQVEVNKASFSQETETRVTGPDQNLFNNAATQVLECVHEGFAVENASVGLNNAAVTGAPQRRFTTFVCNWGNGGPSTFAATVPVGSFGSTNTLLPNAGFLGFVGDQNPPTLSGLAAQSAITPPGLQQGGCWFVGGPGQRGVDNPGGDFANPLGGVLPFNQRAVWMVTLQNYAQGVPVAVPEAPCTPGTGVCPTNRFSAGEWVYFRGGSMPLPQPLGNNIAILLNNVVPFSSFYLNSSGDALSDYSIRTRAQWQFGGGGAIAGLPQLPAVPCNRGIRVPKPSP